MCEQEFLAVQVLGPNIARKLHNRLSDLEAANSIFDLLFVKPQELVLGDVKGFSFNLYDDQILFVEANHNSNPMDSHGNIDWQRVYRIKVKFIGSPENE